MKHYLLPALIAFALGNPLTALAEAVAPVAPPPAPPVAEAPPAAPAAEAPAADPYQQMMEERDAHMQAMYERFAKMWGTKDPAERQKLMEENRQAEQAHREKMRSMRGEMLPQNWQNSGEEGGWTPPAQPGQPGMGRPGMHPGMQQQQGMPPMGQPGMGRGAGPGMMQKHAEVIERLDRIEAMLKTLLSEHQAAKPH